MAVAEQEILEKIRAFPDEKQVEVVRFIENLSVQEKPKRKTIGERIRELTADVPPETWEKIPRDGAEQHDHYIYGTPKR